MTSWASKHFKVPAHFRAEKWPKSKATEAGHGSMHTVLDRCYSILLDAVCQGLASNKAGLEGAWRSARGEDKGGSACLLRSLMQASSTIQSRQPAAAE